MSEDHTRGVEEVAGGVCVSSDTTLRADLVDCPGDGLVIAADGVTLDRGRRTLDGTGAAGVRDGGRNRASGNAARIQGVGVRC